MTVDPSRIAREAIDELAPTLFAKSLRVQFTSARCQIPGNEVLLQQLFTNLLKNAAQYTPEGGSIQMAWSCEAKHWICAVTDPGTGIPAEMREHIFERFFRVDSSRQRESGGASLGLAIARQIAREHGGDVQLEWSEAGQGACFKLRLPR